MNISTAGRRYLTTHIQEDEQYLTLTDVKILTFNLFLWWKINLTFDHKENVAGVYEEIYSLLKYFLFKFFI